MGFLEQVTEHKLKELARRRRAKSLDELERELKILRRPAKKGCQPIIYSPEESDPPFANALSKHGVTLIAEVKRASPARGWLARRILAEDLAAQYEKAGARAVSVLTETAFFGGSLEDLKRVREQVRIPVLCKDFIIDPYQIWEAALFGADAVLLIVRLVGGRLQELLEACAVAGVEALVEAHTLSEAEEALRTGARLIAVNCRDLDTLKIFPERHLQLRPLLGSGILTVAASGISDAKTVRRLLDAGYDGVLMGEALMTAPDPVAKINELLISS